MRISFDLDDTLVCYQPGVPQEPRLPWYLRWLVADEPLRRGTMNLICELRRYGWEVWIYTTSHSRAPLVAIAWRSHRRLRQPGRSRLAPTAVPAGSSTE